MNRCSHIPTGPLPADEHDRRRIRGDSRLETPISLDPDFERNCNIVVSAGAGSGKTTVLVERLIGLIRCGMAPECAAAITFSNKAAGELQERFFSDLLQTMECIEEVMHRSQGPTKEAWQLEYSRLSEAVNSPESPFIGTIHSFCARILRTFSFRAGIPADFSHLDNEEEVRMRRVFWNRLMNVDPQAGSDLALLRDAGVSANGLFEMFGRHSENESVYFPESGTDEIDPGAVFARLLEYVDEFSSSFPVSGKPGAFLKFMWAVQTRRKSNRTFSDHEMVRWLKSSLRMLKSSGDVLDLKVTLWGPRKEERYKLATAIRDGHEDNLIGKPFVAFLQGDVMELIRKRDAWLHDAAIRFVNASVGEYRQMRLEAGKLTFNDMLHQTSRLLFASSRTRSDLQEQFSHILVDEFQDTNPEQASMLFALASQTQPERNTWTTTDLIPGMLMFVGDDKQSIYRFRKADFQAFEEVRQAVQRGEGLDLHLTTNFRSSKEVCDWINGALNSVFKDEPRPYQADWEDLIAHENPSLAEPVVPAVEALLFPAMRPVALREQAEARAIREWILDIRQEYGDTTSFSDFLVLVRRTKNLPLYLDVLSEAGIPATISGGDALELTDVLQTFDDVLRATFNPDDGASLAATLRGPLFGASDQDLYDYSISGYSWRDLVLGTDELPSAPESIRFASNQLRRFHEANIESSLTSAFENLLKESGYEVVLAGRRDGGLGLGMLDTIWSLFSQWDNTGYSMGECITTLGKYRRGELELNLFSHSIATADSVRLMTIHQSKGLQSDYVMLTDCGSPGNHSVEMHVQRQEAKLIGFAPLTGGKFGRKEEVIAPSGWPEAEAREIRFTEAESMRLAYVACTRAAKQLVICVNEQPGSGSWDFLHPAISDLSTPTKVAGQESETTRVLDDTGDLAPEMLFEDVQKMISVSKDASWHMKRPSTEDELDEPRSAPASSGTGEGVRYGRAIHQLFEAVVAKRKDGIDPSERSTLVSEVLQANLDGESARRLEEAARQTIDNFMDSRAWESLQTADRVLTEVPFTTSSNDDVPVVTSGVVDLAFRNEDGWTIVDYKTDNADENVLLDRHAEQIKAYVRAWRTLFEDQSCTGLLWSTKLGKAIEVESIK